ncbi:MAG: hypothetical protein HWE26_11720 [Alteromonadaceae bacterium]|nr:hypothetical protein [Alteromonadaceae bacterium]
MPLILPTGLQMAFSMGILQVSIAAMGLIWLVSLIWLTVIIGLHFLSTSTPGWLHKCDWLLRIGVCIATLSYGFGSLLVDTQLYADWAAWKLGFFGITVLMGLCIRIKLKPFFNVFPNVVNNTIDPQVNMIIKEAIVGARPFVMIIWASLFVVSALGLHLI